MRREEFYIKNTKAPKVMSPNELLALQPKDFVQYSLREDNEDYDAIMAAPISEYGVMLMGRDEHSGRGFEVAYDSKTKQYDVRVFTPSTLSDWDSALLFIKNLGQHLGSQVVDEEEVTYAPEAIDYDYRNDIAFGLQHYQENSGFIFGCYRPLCIDGAVREALLAAEDKVQFFSDWVVEQQNLDAFVATPMFYQDRKSKAIYGAYAITEGVPTVLPYEYPPFIDPTRWDIKEEDIDKWELTMVVINGDENDPEAYEVIASINYRDFLAHLPEDSYEVLDGHYMVATLTREVMKELSNEV